MQVVAGNHVTRAAAGLGWSEIAAVVMDMTDKQAKAYLASDNRMSELGDVDDDLLAKLLVDIAKHDTLEGTGYSAEDLDDLLAKVGTPTKHGFGDTDASHAIPDEPWVKDGEVYTLGQHRIACGVPSDPLLDRLFDGKQADLLIVTPPSTFTPVQTAAYFGKVHEQFWFSAEKYIEHFTSAAKGSWLVWDKGADAFDGQFGPSFELIWTKDDHKREILRHTLIGVADGEKHGGPDFSERPTALFMAIYERYSHFEAIVADPFAVGATSLLAAEKTGRVWYGAKESPAHVQALLEKWAEFTGSDVKDIEKVEG